MIDQDQSIETIDNDSFIEIKGLVPANPIYVKPVTSQQPRAIFKMQVIKNEIVYRDPPLKPLIMKKQQQSEEDQIEEKIIQPSSQLGKYVTILKCIYMKFNNSTQNKLNKTEYFSGLFIDRRQFRENKTQLKTIKSLFTEIIGENLPKLDEFLSNPNDIKFDSNFESGNLFSAYKRTQKQYDLVLQNDTNSKGNTQWFYFSVTNLPKDVDITLNIINLSKSDSLFNYGMQPAVFSKCGNKKSGLGWYKDGKDISYKKNSIKRQNSKKFYYTLSFKIKSLYQGDTLYLAHCFPYSYSSLNEYLDIIVKNPYRKNFIQRSIIGKSVGNNNIQVLTISEPLPIIKDPRKIIVFIARQHPGESQGSFICQGIVNYLVSKSKEAEFLRSKYIFKIIPMINPDGVIFGNYRTSLSGSDLNRKWDNTDNQIFPEITSVKTLITQLNKDKKIRMIIDLHGHSKKLNSFFYGNPSQTNPQSVRLFPYTCSKINSQVTFQDCTFSINQQKKNTARVYLSLIHQISCIYTYEASFFGFIKQGRRLPFGIDQFRGLGYTLGQALFNILQYQFSIERKQNTSHYVVSKYINQLKTNLLLIQQGNRDSSGSDSQPQLFQLKQVQITTLREDLKTIKKQKEHLKRLNRLISQNYNNDDNTHSQSTLCNQTSQINCLPSRSTIRSSKQSSRNTKKKMVAYSLNKVNAFSPLDFQLGLAPLTRQTPSRHQRTTIKALQFIKYEIQTQTLTLHQKDWIMMKKVQCDHNVTSYKNWKTKQMKFAPISTTTRIRKNLTFRFSQTPKQFLSINSINTHKVLKNKQQATQTNLSCIKQDYYDQKVKIMSSFQTNDRLFKAEPMPIIRALKIHSIRKDNLIFDDFYKKQQTDSNKLKIKTTQGSGIHIFNEKTKNGDSIEKSLSIKKKQIAYLTKRNRKNSN